MRSEGGRHDFDDRSVLARGTDLKFSHHNRPTDEDLNPKY
jgi:hypothetical protein